MAITLGQALEITFNVYASPGGTDYTDADSPPPTYIKQIGSASVATANSATYDRGCTWSVVLEPGEVQSAAPTLEWSGSGIVSGSKQFAPYVPLGNGFTPAYAAPQTYYGTQGDTKTLPGQFVDDSGNPIDISGQTITIYIGVYGSPAIITQTAEIVSAAQGQVQYTLTPSDAAKLPPQTYEYQFLATTSGNQTSAPASAKYGYVVQPLA